LTDIRVPFQAVVPPRATTEIEFARNLDSESSPVGSILYSQAFRHAAGNADLAVGLSDHAGASLHVQVGDVLAFSVTSRSATVSSTLTIAPGTDLADIAKAITAFLRGPSVDAGPGATADVVTGSDSRSLRGALTLFGIR